MVGAWWRVLRRMGGGEEGEVDSRGLIDFWKG